MSRLKLHILLVCTLLGGLLSSSKYSSSIQKQIKDFEAFKLVIKNKEGVLNLNVSAESFDSVLEDLKFQLAKEDYDLIEEFKLFSHALSKLECGHTQMYPTRKLWDEYATNAVGIPFDYKLVGKRLFTCKLDPDDWNNVLEEKGQVENWQLLLPDCEILRIDGKTPVQLMEKMGAYISSDKDAIEFKYYQATELFEFYRHLAFPLTKDSVEIVYVEDDDTLSMNVSPGKIPRNSIRERNIIHVKDFTRNSMNHGSFKIIDNKYGYFRFKSFMACYGSSYNQFLKSSFSKMRNDSIQNLVIDLRGNTGGVMQYEIMKYFIGKDQFIGKYIVQKPKTAGDSKYIRKFNDSFWKHWKMSKAQAIRIKLDEFNGGDVYTEEVDSSLIFDGSIVVITDEGTFSSAGILASNLKIQANAKIIGQPAGGTFYAGNSGTLEAVLPQSKLTFSINPNTFYSSIADSSYNASIKEPEILIFPRPMKSNKLDAIYFDAAISLFKE